MKPNSPSIKVHNEQSQGRPGKTSMLYAGNDVLRPEYANKRSVWTITTKPYSDAHFATYPEKLIQPCILAGCPENGIVLDPFMGAGTTALVARKLNRNYIGFELNPEYIKIANKRLNTKLGLFL
jgi:DNA modification methylase